NTWHFYHDNIELHSSPLIHEFLVNHSLKVLEHPSYSPDLAPCDFGFFPLMKKKLKTHAQKFNSDNEFLATWDQECANISVESWQQIFNKWFIRITKCKNYNGD
ncbi:hypothetical protein EAI_11213, partial [Harpegnathos saltator]